MRHCPMPKATFIVLGIYMCTIEVDLCFPLNNICVLKNNCREQTEDTICNYMTVNIGDYIIFTMFSVPADRQRHCLLGYKPHHST